MKKFITFIAFAIALLTSTVANAQSFNSNPYAAYDNCKMCVQQGDEDYNNGAFNSAETNYLKARDFNYQCPDKKFISDKKLSKKISDCEYALSHNGKTRQQANAEVVGAILGTALVVGAVATAANASNHDVHEHHHDFHPEHHHDFHPEHHHDFGPHHHGDRIVEVYHY